jgi:hypothetical protein
MSDRKYSINLKIFEKLLSVTIEIVVGLSLKAQHTQLFSPTYRSLKVDEGDGSIVLAN